MAKNKFKGGKKNQSGAMKVSAVAPPIVTDEKPEAEDEVEEAETEEADGESQSPAKSGSEVEDDDDDEDQPEPSLEEMAINLRAILAETEVKARRLRDSMELPQVQLEELEDKLAVEEKQRKTLEETVSSLERAHAAARGQIEVLEKQLLVLEEEKGELATSIGEHETRLEDVNEKLEEAIKARQRMADQLSEAERAREDLEQRIQTGADDAAEKLRDLERAREELEERLRNADESHGAALREFETKIARLEEAEEKLQAAIARRDELEDMLKDLEARLKEAESGSTGLLSKQREAENRLGEMEEQLQSAQASLLESEDKLAEAERQRKSLEAQMEEGGKFKEQLEKLEEDARQLREELEAAQSAAAEHDSRSQELQKQLESQTKGFQDAETRATELREMLEMLEANLLEAEDKLAAAPSRTAFEEAQARAAAAEEKMTSAAQSAEEAEHKLKQTEFRLEQIKQIYEETDEATRAAEERADAAEKRAREAERKLRSLEVATGRIAGAGELAPAEAAPTSSADLSALHEKLENSQRLELEALERAELAEAKQAELEEEAREANERAAELEEKFSEVEANSIQLREELENARRELEGARDVADGAGLTELKKKLEETEARAKAAEQKSRESVDRLFQAEQRMVQASARTRTAEEKIVELEREMDNLKRKYHEAEERMKSGEPGELDPETERMAFEDRLTNLPNFNILQQYIDYTFKQVHRYKRGAALLCIDLDRFKVINDTLGFRAGDEVLRQVADRLRALTRESDVLGRRGDDEFLILLSELEKGDLPEVRTPDDWMKACNQMATLVSNRILAALAPPYSVQNQKLHVTASVGASISLDAETAEEFIEHAETAMVAAKEAGRNNLQFYSADLKLRRQRKLSLDGQLRQALENDEFTLLYQPIVHLSSGRLAGAEALLRWKHPEMGRLLAPADFLNIADETGLIVPIGAWALMQGCHQAHLWAAEGLEIFTAINLSTRQLMQADLAKTFLNALEVTNIDPKSIVLDINEGSNLVDPERTDLTLEELARTGVAIALDDFGVGFSSLKRLGQVKMLKFDRSLVSDVKSRHGSSICVAVLGICQSLGVRSVAEGVETPEQATFFLDKGCELAQGFYFSEPVTPEEITEMWLDNRTWSGF